MGNIIVLLVIALLVGGASFKIYRDRKNGNMCTGCAMSKQCSEQYKKSDNEFIIK